MGQSSVSTLEIAKHQFFPAPRIWPKKCDQHEMLPRKSVIADQHWLKSSHSLPIILQSSSNSAEPFCPCHSFIKWSFVHVFLAKSQRMVWNQTYLPTNNATPSIPISSLKLYADPGNTDCPEDFTLLHSHPTIEKHFECSLLIPFSPQYQLLPLPHPHLLLRIITLPGTYKMLASWEDS